MSIILLLYLCEHWWECAGKKFRAKIFSSKRAIALFPIWWIKTHNNRYQNYDFEHLICFFAVWFPLYSWFVTAFLFIITLRYLLFFSSFSSNRKREHFDAFTAINTTILLYMYTYMANRKKTTWTKINEKKVRTKIDRKLKSNWTNVQLKLLKLQNKNEHEQ